MATKRVIPATAVIILSSPVFQAIIRDVHPWFISSGKFFLGLAAESDTLTGNVFL